MSTYAKRTTTKRGVHRRPRMSHMAPVRRGGDASTARCPATNLVNPDGRLLLSNIGSNIKSTLIEKMFTDFGDVAKVVIHSNGNHKPIGTAEVWMSSGKEANKAKTKLNATDIFNDGRIIRIERIKMTTKLGKFWKSVFEYVSKIEAKLLSDD